MQKKIIILSSGHPPLDERIFWKFGRTLTANGFQVIISTSTVSLQLSKEGITIDSFDSKNMKKKEKVNHFFSILEKYNPDLIICCEPITILPASRYRKKSNNNIFIISDVTEWYPENYTSRLKGLRKYSQFIILWLFNIYSSLLVDGMIIGEKSKKRRYDFIAPFKKKEIIGYYPILEYFNYSPPLFNGNSITFCYAGLLKYDRGILTLLELSAQFKKLFAGIDVKLKLAGKFESSAEADDFQLRIKQIIDFEIQVIEWQEYPVISDVISDADICFDLRFHNFVYNNSLPIKVFEYMAAGKPFIFTDIKPLKQLRNITNYGHLVEPDDISAILNILKKYVSQRRLLHEHSRAARKQIETDYNWEKESFRLISFINSFSK